MKYLKMLGLAAVAAAALMAFVGAGTASATTLTGSGGGVLPTGSTIHAVNEGVVKITTSFKNIECEESTIQGKTTNETGTSVSGTVEVLTFLKCNCEVAVFKKGTLSITWAGAGNGSVVSNGAEITVQCQTVFGNVHCIYTTANTTLGTLTGSNTTSSTATMDIESAAIPRVSTSSLCDEVSRLDAKYSITTPDTLNVIN